MLEDMTPPVSVRSCKVATEAAKLNDKDRKILLDAIADRDRWPIKSLSRALNERGVALSDTPLTSHRAKACACFA